MTRMTAERLKEIESATSYESGNPQVQAVYRELLAELRAVQQERDEARAAQDENADACEAMSREVERLHNSANMWSKAAQDNKDNMDAWASECKTLRAELAEIQQLRARVVQLEEALKYIVDHAWASEMPKWGNEFVAVARAALDGRDEKGKGV